MLPRIKRVEGSNQIRFAGQLKIKAVHQLCVATRQDTHRETTLEAGNTRHGPPVQCLPFQTLVLRNGKLPEVTDDHPVPCVEQGEGTIAAVTDGLQDVFEARSVVYGLAEGVRHLELEAMAESSFQRRLQGVVVRVGDGVLGEDAGEHGDTVRGTTVD